MSLVSYLMHFNDFFDVPNKVISPGSTFDYEELEDPEIKEKNSTEMKPETLKLNHSIIHESLNGLSEPSPKFGQC